MLCYIRLAKPLKQHADIDRLMYNIQDQGIIIKGGVMY